MLLSPDDIRDALARLGELALERGSAIELVVVGGAAMALFYNGRRSTADVDVASVAPMSMNDLAGLVAQVARERDLPTTWLNDHVRVYVSETTPGPDLFDTKGIRVRGVSLEQMIGLKLSALRSATDRDDLVCLLKQTMRPKDAIWRAIQPFILVTKADNPVTWYDFEDAWSEAHLV